MSADWAMRYPEWSDMFWQYEYNRGALATLTSILLVIVVFYGIEVDFWLTNILTDFDSLLPIVNPVNRSLNFFLFKNESCIREQVLDLNSNIHR